MANVPGMVSCMQLCSVRFCSVLLWLLIALIWPRPAAAQDALEFTAGQALGNATSHDVALGDLNGDGALDAFVVNGNGPAANQIWFNDGSGQFTAGQALGNRDSYAVALGDLNGNGYLDAVVANSDGLNQVWLNDGTGQFTAGQSLEESASRNVALGDLNGNGHLDILFANSSGDTIWFNSGNATFIDSGQSLVFWSSYGVALGDLDGNDSLDAFFTTQNYGHAVWLNEGNGQFGDSEQVLGGLDWGYAVALGDLDGNGARDAFVANWFPNPNTVWFNDGNGNFADSGQRLGEAASIDVALADLTGDGVLDAVVANNTPDGVRIWRNNGDGTFTDSGTHLDETTTYAVGVGDLDGDGTPDIFAANFGPNRVWFQRRDDGLPAARFDVARTRNDAGEDVTHWASHEDPMLPVRLHAPAPHPLQVQMRIESSTPISTGTIATGTISTGQLTAYHVVTPTLAFDEGEQLMFVQLINPQPELTTAITLTLFVTQPVETPTDHLVLIFVDGEQGIFDCILCYAEWLARFLGLNPTFGALHHMDLPTQKDSPLWPYYAALFKLYSPEMTRIMAIRPGQLYAALQVLHAWTPAVAALSAGEPFVVSETMVKGVGTFFTDLQTHASPGLGNVIARELAALDMATFGGLNIDAAWNEFATQRSLSRTFVPIIYR